MADKKISQLTAATTPLAGTEVLPIVQGTSTVKVPVSDLTAGRAVAMASATITGDLAVDTNVLKVDTTNNRVGINITSPNETLRVVGTSGSPQFGAGTGGNAVFVNAYDSGSIYMTASASNSTAFGFGSATNIPLFFMTNNSERGRFDTSGNLSVTNGNVVISTSGKGIDFSVTSEGSGTMTSELLADYEEGTWTGTLTAATPPTTPITATGTYTKVGRLVMYNIYFLNVDTTGSAGAVSVTGLPYTVGATAEGNVVSNAFANPTSTQLASGTTTASIVISQTAVGATMTATTGRYVFITGSYNV